MVRRPHKKDRSSGFLSIFLVVILLVIVIWLSHREDEYYIEVSGNKYLRGVDISRYQGEVDYNLLQEQEITFAFIKATEGRAHLDPFFYDNLKAGLDSDIRVGAYHFYRFDVSGEEQGKFFISHVPKDKRLLPPVIDIEHYGEYVYDPQDKDIVVQEMTKLIDVLTDYYDQNPIIYCNYYIYKDYIQGNFEDCDIWYRSIGDKVPVLPDDREWVFWQYSETGKLDGYGGVGYSEDIDLNYYDGSIRDLKYYGR